MKNPLISVIMPSYNHSQFVQEAMHSVLSQEGVNIEFLIADDGSKDGTPDAISQIKDSRITFFDNKVNQGAVAVTNDLIKRSSGEFIALINSDDAWSRPDKLSLQLKVLQSDLKLGACFGRAKFFDKNSTPIDKNSLPFGKVFDEINRSQGDWLRRFFDLSNCLCHPTILVRRECYQKVGLYDERFRQLPDYEMWIRLVKHYSIHVSDQELINFRILPGESASDSSIINNRRVMNEHLLIADSYFEGVSTELLVSGFGDLLKNKDTLDSHSQKIETALLYLNYNPHLGAPYELIGMLKISALINNVDFKDILFDKYGIDFKWLHKKTGEISVLKG
jgi:glycosyltransferase involved in cell wall biosynthesis